MYRHANTAVLAVSAVEGPEVVTSDHFDERLAGTLRRLGLRPGLLQGLAGIHERRWFDKGTTFVDAAATAGAKALAEAGIEPSRVGLMINSSVSRAYLEPSSAVAIHHQLGLPTSCMNFDLANACLGFVNAMHVAATMIDAGHIEYALVVDGEDARYTQEATIARLERDSHHGRRPVPRVRDADPRVRRGRAWSSDPQTGTRARTGCSAASPARRPSTTSCASGNLDCMSTDTKGLMDAGLDLAEAAWTDDGARRTAGTTSTATSSTRCRPCTRARCARGWGSTRPGAADVPGAGQRRARRRCRSRWRVRRPRCPGDRVLCMGIGSGPEHLVHRDPLVSRHR